VLEPGALLAVTLKILPSRSWAPRRACNRLQARTQVISETYVSSLAMAATLLGLEHPEGSGAKWYATS
jgi:hypothetical protein